MEQALPLREDSHAETFDQLGPGKIHRHHRPRNIGDHAVHRRIEPLDHARTDHHLGPRRGQARRHRTRQFHQRLGAQRLGHRLRSPGFFHDECQPFPGIGEMGSHSDLHHGDLIAGAIPVIIGPDRHWRPDFHGLLRQVVLGFQISAHRAADHRDHYVVHRCTGKSRANFLDVRQREFAPVKHAVRAELLVEPGLGNAPLCIIALAKLPLHLQQPFRHRDQFLQILEAANRIGDIVELRLGKQGERIGVLFRLELHVERARLHLGVKIVQGQRHLQPGLAIDRCMMHLVQHGKAALRHALDIVEPLDHRIFPERLVHVHRPRVDPRHLNAQLPPVSRLRQRNMADMIFKIEICVIDPIGMV